MKKKKTEMKTETFKTLIVYIPKIIDAVKKGFVPINNSTKFVFIYYRLILFRVKGYKNVRYFYRDNKTG